MAYIEVHLRDGRTEHFELDNPSKTIGRSSKVDIRIPEPIISRLHARIQQTDDSRWIIIDMDSRNKTHYNKRPIKSHVLTNDDAFYLGSIKVIFQDHSGSSDEDIDKTEYLTEEDANNKQAETNERSCPVCKSLVPEYAVICVECGYNFKSGKRLTVNLDSKIDLDEKEEPTANPPDQRQQ